MSLKSKISSAFTLAFAVAAFATFASAQDAKTQDGPQKFEGGEHHRGMRGDKGGRHDGMRGGGMAAFRGIEFTDAQKEQLRQIHEANKPSDAEIAEMQAMHEARK